MKDGITHSKVSFCAPADRRAAFRNILRNTVFLGEGSVHQPATV
jgi:hypothetical protein